MAENKGSNGKIIGIVVGVLAVVAVVVTCVLLFGKGDSIKTVADFKQAITDRKALNCSVTAPDGTTVMIQTDEGFKRIKVAAEEDGVKMFTLMHEDGTVWLWTEDGSMAYKMVNEDMKSDLISEITPDVDDETEDDGYSFECKSPDASGLEAPADVDFLDLSDLMGGGDEEDELGDGEY